MFACVFILMTGKNDIEVFLTMTVKGMGRSEVSDRPATCYSTC